ncbi:MAG: M48 family metallopeptidase [Pirellulaceae bacterium]|nr:M48 family metallopeptidase [Planctomycetales bacterium]
MSMDRRTWILNAMAAWMGGVAACGCKSAPMTGRKQLLLMPEDQEVSLGAEAYDQVLTDEAPSQNARYIDLVNRVGQRIAAQSQRTDFDWQFTVIASPTQNAFCLPGGKVAVYEGILPVCQNEAGLAVVMSHEVAHALARHGGERMSQSFAVDQTKAAINYVMRKEDESRRELLMQAYGLSTEYGVLLPYSRKQESEADHIGIMLMASAGYDPQQAPGFWHRFASVGGTKPPEFLSTHPADERRARDLETLIPEAMDRYSSAGQQFGAGESLS